MSFKSFIVAGALALSAPLAANAAIITGDFVEGGTVNTLSGMGVVGQTNIAVDTSTGTSSYEFVFEVDPAAAVAGSGTVKRDSTVLGLEVLFNGVAVDLHPVGATDTLSFAFGPEAFYPGSPFSLTIAYEAAASTDNIDFDIELAPVPVPAAGLLLLTALGAGSIAARRRKS